MITETEFVAEGRTFRLQAGEPSLFGYEVLEGHVLLKFHPSAHHATSSSFPSSVATDRAHFGAGGGGDIWYLFGTVGPAVANVIFDTSLRPARFPTVDIPGYSCRFGFGLFAWEEEVFSYHLLSEAGKEIAEGVVGDHIRKMREMVAARRRDMS